MTRFISPLLVATAIAVVASPSPAEAASLETVIESIADRIEAYLNDKNQLQINIGEFNGPPGTSSGRKVKNLLETELKDRSIDIAPFSRWEVRGDFEVQTEGQFATVALITRLVNQQGVEVADFRQRVRDSIDNLKDVLDIAQPAAVDLESAVVENTSVVDSTPPAASGGAGASSGAERPAATVGNTQPATPPAAGSSAGGTPPAAGNPPPASGASVAGTPPAGGTPLASGNPPAGGTLPAGGTVTGGTGPGGVAVAQGGGLPDSATRDQRLLESLKTGGFHHVNPNTIAASASSPYHVQLRVLRAGASEYLPAEIQEVGNGLAFCDLRDGDHYAVIITNTAPHDIGVELMIDGINSLHFSEVPGFAETGKWMIRGTNNNGGVPYSAMIKGWYRNPQSVYAFRVGAEPDAVASQLGFPAKIGTITATFYGAWVGDDVHPLEAKLAAEFGRARGVGIGTARGAVTDSQSNVVERKFGRFPLASVSIRYVNPDPPEDLPIEPAN